MKIIIIFTFIFSVLLHTNNVNAGETKKEEKQSKEEQITLIKEQLEFLSSKLLKITQSKEYVIEHQGHELLVFGACGNGNKRGIKINCVSPGSTAEEMGVKSGDIITTVNGKNLNNLPGKEASSLYYQEIDALRDGDTISIVYLHKGQEIKKSGIIKSYNSPGYTFGVTIKPEK